MADLIRLNKYLATLTGRSRRDVDDLLAKGKITINGEVAGVGIKIDPDTKPIITVLGYTVKPKNVRFTYVLMNKPDGYVVTRATYFDNEQSVMKILPRSLQHLKPVGRLDKHTTGALLFTDDGELMNQMTHPRYQHEKEYIVSVKYPLKPADIQAWAKGVPLEEGNTGPNEVEQLDEFRFRIILRQGWNRQIRRMVEVRDNRVRQLQRIRLGKITLGNLPVGEFKIIPKKEVEA